jgi:hypothetical protein
MRFNGILESNRNVDEELITFIKFNGYVLCLLSWVLGAHMILNVVVTKWGQPSLYGSGWLSFGSNLLLPTKGDTETTLKPEHLRSFAITRCHLKPIPGVISLHIRRKKDDITIFGSIKHKMSLQQLHTQTTNALI